MLLMDSWTSCSGEPTFFGSLELITLVAFTTPMTCISAESSLVTDEPFRSSVLLMFFSVLVSRFFLNCRLEFWVILVHLLRAFRQLMSLGEFFEDFEF